MSCRRSCALCSSAVPSGISPSSRSSSRSRSSHVGQTITENAQNLNIGFNGPDLQFPYMDTFYAATEACYQTLGRQMPGNRHCHAYLSWDIAEQGVGSGPIGTEGSRSWFEDWLSHAQGHCDEALITFKYVGGVTSGTGFPAVSDSKLHSRPSRTHRGPIRAGLVRLHLRLGTSRTMAAQPAMDCTQC